MRASGCSYAAGHEPKSSCAALQVTCSGYRLFIYDLLAGDIVPGDIYDL
jgi:hypothetical protein